MKRSLQAIAVALVVLLTGLVSGVFNLQAKNQAVNGAWQEVSASYRERAALLPRYLLSVNKHILQPEDQKIVKIVEQGVLGASRQLANTPPATIQSFTQMIDSQAELTRAMAQLAVISERYPSLHTDPEFLRLNAQFRVIEEKITRGWSSYNQVAHNFNLFKKSILARFANGVICRYDEKVLFGAEEGASVVLGLAG